MKETGNIYRNARGEAVAKKPLLSSRARAAGALYVSQEALQDYETGKTLPPCDVVQRMVEVYGAPDLRRLHIRACCPLLPDYGGETESELTRAALAWAVEFSRVDDMTLRFAELARDGRITAGEREAALTIREKAVRLRRMMEETISAVDTALAAAKEEST